MTPLNRRELLATSLAGVGSSASIKSVFGGRTLEATGSAYQHGSASCDWLEYSVDPSKVRNLPASYGNNRVMFRCDIRRPEVSGLCSSVIRASGKPPKDRDILTAVYDAETGEKYPLSLDYARSGRVFFRPEQHIWQLEFEDFKIEARAFAPPGLFAYCTHVKIEASKRMKLRLFREILGFGDPKPRDIGAEKAWVEGDLVLCDLRPGTGMASGSTLQGGKFTLSKMFSGYVYDILAQYDISLDPGIPLEFSFARAIAKDAKKAGEDVAYILSNPAKRLAEATDYWNDFLQEIPQFSCPDEQFVKAHCWMWANFRINQWDVDEDALPNGQWGTNYGGYLHDQVIGNIDNMEAAAAVIYWMPQAVKDLVEIMWSTQREDGQVPGIRGVYFDSGKGRVQKDSFMMDGGPSTLLQITRKYVEYAGDMAFLEEEIEGVPLIERMEKGIEWYNKNRFRQELGLYWTIGGDYAWMDLAEKYRGSHSSYCDYNAFLVGALADLAFLEEALGRSDKARVYSKKSKALAESVNRLMWNADLGMYVDVDAEGKQIVSKHAFSFTTGFLASFFMNGVRGLADDDKARALVENLESEAFNRPYGLPSLAWDSPYYDPDNHEIVGLVWHYQMEMVRGLYWAGQTEAAHRLLKKLFRLHWGSEGLGPRYMAEAYSAETGQMFAGGRYRPAARSFNYPANFNLITGLYEGVFGLRVDDGLEVNVNSPWPEASVSNLRVLGHKVGVSWSKDKGLTLSVDGQDVIKNSKDRKGHYPSDRLQVVARDRTLHQTAGQKSSRATPERIGTRNSAEI